jgi:hypothetical protein
VVGVGAEAVVAEEAAEAQAVAARKPVPGSHAASLQALL